LEESRKRREWSNSFCPPLEPNTVAASDDVDMVLKTCLLKTEMITWHPNLS